MYTGTIFKTMYRGLGWSLSLPLSLFFTFDFRVYFYNVKEMYSLAENTMSLNFIEVYLNMIMDYTQRWWTLHKADGCCEVLTFNFCILINKTLFKYPVVFDCVTHVWCNINSSLLRKDFIKCFLHLRGDTGSKLVLTSCVFQSCHVS
jgi:hypothetical protein